MKGRGFSSIEIIVVVGIIGIILVASFPSILNVLETRSLEGTARDLLTTLETARYLAVNEKVPCRVRFFQENNEWRYLVEIQVREVDQTTVTWITARKFLKRSLPPKYNPQLLLPPDQTIVFSPLGMIANYDFTSPQSHRITLQSQKLRNYGKEDLRIVNVYAGGSIAYIKAKSQG
ncbi:MAG: GspH/FimT family protein [Candidatus Aminicenantales bacterium]